VILFAEAFEATPMQMLLLPVVRLPPEPCPIAMFPAPFEDDSELVPTATQFAPVVFEANALVPIAVLLAPDVLIVSAFAPKAALFIPVLIPVPIA
jgi:hypothetical protein